MKKVKGWIKLEKDVYRTTKPGLFKDYRYIWIDSRNKVRIFYTIRKVNKLYLQMIKQSEILTTATSEITARKYMFEYMKGTV